MNGRIGLKGWAFALVAGLGVAALWAGIAHATEREFGLLAWAAGGVIAFALGMGGGHGTRAAVAAGAITIAAIAGGKVLALGVAVDALVLQQADQYATRDIYDGIRLAASDFAKVNGSAGYPAYMASHRYSESEDPNQVTEQEIASFKAEAVPRLQDFTKKNPTFETWRAEFSAEAAAEIRSNISPWLLFKSAFRFLDVIFLVLGVATAARMAGNFQRGED